MREFWAVTLWGVLLAVGLGWGIEGFLDRGEVVVQELPEMPEGEGLREEEVELESGDVRLAGTLSLPTGEGPFPGVLLLTGSGPQDRDGTLWDRPRHRHLAHALAGRGIAVLRLDDRGVGGSGGDTALATLDDLVADAVMGVHFLRTRPAIDGERVGLYGPSQGSLVAQRVAVEHPEAVAFLVLAAAIGKPMGEIFVEQHKARARALGLPEGTVAKVGETVEEVLAIVLSEAPEEERAALLRPRVRELERWMAGGDLAALAVPMDRSGRLVESALTPAMVDLLKADPVPVVERIEVPLLALWGGLDLQVDGPSNSEALERALVRAGNRDVEFQLFPGLDHFLLPTEDGLSPSAPPGVIFGDGVVERIAGWIEARFVLEEAS